MRSAMAFLVAAVAACAGPATAQSTSIELLPQSRVAGARVALGDVAVIHSSDLGQLRELAGLPVAVSPAAGGSIVLARARLASYVAARTAAADVEWRGAASTRVRREAGAPDEEAATLAAAAPSRTAWLVRRGDWAVLAAGEGGVAVQSRVEVLQDGRAGQRVLVRGMAWPQPVAARVVGPGALEPTR